MQSMASCSSTAFTEQNHLFSSSTTGLERPLIAPAIPFLPLPAKPRLYEPHITTSHPDIHSSRKSNPNFPTSDTRPRSKSPPCSTSSETTRAKTPKTRQIPTTPFPNPTHHPHNKQSRPHSLSSPVQNIPIPPSQPDPNTPITDLSSASTSLRSERKKQRKSFHQSGEKQKHIAA